MTPFAIAGVQMHVAALTENVAAMAHRLEILMARFPWVQMVLFSELCPYGPLPKFAHAFPNDAEARFQELAHHYNVWLIPGSMFEKAADGRMYNTATVINPSGPRMIPMPTRLKSGDSMFSRWPGLSISPSCTCSALAANARFSPANR